MSTTLARRVNAAADALGLGTSASAAVFTVDSWAAYAEMCRLLDLGAPRLPRSGGFRYRTMPPPDAPPDPEGDDQMAAQRAAVAREEFTALPALPRDAGPLAVRARAVLGASVAAGGPRRPVLDPFVSATSGPRRSGSPAYVRGAGEHAGLVAVTPAFAAEWAAEWERGRTTGQMPNIPNGRVSVYWWLA